VGILVRNFELMDQLRTTMQAERQASEIARSTAEAKAALADRLDESENELGLLRLRLLRTQEESRDHLAARRRTEEQLALTREQRTRLSGRVVELETTQQSQQKNIEALKEQQQELLTRR
jgi:chromosome segregation ATPase